MSPMLRINLLQQGYFLIVLALELSLFKVPTMHRFAGIELISDRILNALSILPFRLLLEKHVLGEQIVETVK